MAKESVPQDVLLPASGTLSGDQPWHYGEQTVIRNDIAHAVLSGVPDGWAKVDGEWVRLAPHDPADDDGVARIFKEVR